MSLSILGSFFISTGDPQSRLLVALVHHVLANDFGVVVPEDQ